MGMVMKQSAVMIGFTSLFAGLILIFPVILGAGVVFGLKMSLQRLASYCRPEPTALPARMHLILSSSPTTHEDLE